MALPRSGVRSSSHTVAHRLAHARAASRRMSDTTRKALMAMYRDLTEDGIPSEPIMTRHARTFRFATRFFPPNVRTETIQLYAFFRTIDDLVDESDLAATPPGVIRAELDAWRRWFFGGMDGPSPRPEIASDLAQVVRAHAVPVEYFLAFLDGMYADLEPIRMQSREDVESYSYQVASTVGLAMTHVFGATSTRAKKAARELGIAMQLTNILRDVGGDLGRGRLYLPSDLLSRHGLPPEDIVRMWRDGHGPDDRMKRALAEVVTWADEYYLAGEAGIGLLPEDARLPVRLASRLYQLILRELERNSYDSLHTRVSTSRWQKLRMLSTCVLDPDLGVDGAQVGEDVGGAVSVPEGE